MTGSIRDDAALGLLAGFFAGTEVGELRIPRCEACQRWHWYPKHRCPWCGDAGWSWHPAGSRAHLYTWARPRRAFHPDLSGREGEVVALVTVDEAPGVRLVTNLRDIDHPEIGMALEVGFDDVGGRCLPVFRPIPSPTEGDPVRSSDRSSAREKAPTSEVASDE